MRRGIIFGIAAAAALVFSASAGATVYHPPISPTNVNNADGVCSLREAVMAANSDMAYNECLTGAGSDEIALAPGIYSMDSQLALGDATPGDNLVIRGAENGPSAIAIAPGNFERVIFVLPGTGGASIVNTVITGGRLNVAAFGGGISVGANTRLFLNGSTVFDNEVGASGGMAEGDGGGIGIANSAGTAVTLLNSTISGNRASRDGGGVDSSGSALVVAALTTITGNTADTNSAMAPGGNGGGFSKSAGTFQLGGNIIAGNTDQSGQAPDCKGLNLGTNQNFGGNVFGSTDGCNYSPPGSGDDFIGDPLLGPLAYNGGAMPTHAIPANSPAVDRVTNTNFCQPGFDQHGIPRPQGPACDSGSYEFQVVMGSNTTPQTTPAAKPPAKKKAKCKTKKAKRKKSTAAAAAKKCKKAKKK